MRAKFNKKNKKLSKRKWVASCLAFIAIILFIVMVCIARVNFIEFVDEYTSANIYVELINNLNIATSKTLAKNEIYQDYNNFVDIQKDNDGNVSYIHTNMLLANILLCDVIEQTQQSITSLCQNKVFQVPANAMTGSMLLAQFGKHIEVELTPIGNVDCDFASRFDQAGINQTKHSLYIDITAHVQMILPLYVRDVEIKTSFMICENIIVGKVPEFYLGGNQKDNLLDLIA